MFGLLQRRSFFLGTLAAAVGVPYFLNEPALRGKLDGLLDAAQHPADASARAPAAALDGQFGGHAAAAPATSPYATLHSTSLNSADSAALPTALAGPPVRDFAEVLRFDITPTWIINRWSRVSTVLAEYDLEGLRVPFVSGTQLDDVAGSLTYYYDKRHQLQRIAFEGHTGDPRRFAAHVQQYFGLKPEPSLYAGLLMAKWNGQPKSALLIRHAPVVTSDSPYSRLQLRMEINRPDNYYQVSLPFQRELQEGNHSSRWGT